MGFELNLYSNHELPEITFYIQYLYGATKTHLRNVQFNDLNDQLSNLHVSKALPPTLNATIECFTSHEISMAHFELCCFLMDTGSISRVSCDFYNPKCAYANRFKSVSVLGSPKYLDYDSSQELITKRLRIPVEDSVVSLTKCLNLCKVNLSSRIKSEDAKSFDVEGYKMLLKTCITNLIFLQSIDWNEHADGSRRTIIFNFKFHHSFPVLEYKI